MNSRLLDPDDPRVTVLFLRRIALVYGWVTSHLRLLASWWKSNRVVKSNGRVSDRKVIGRDGVG